MTPKNAIRPALLALGFVSLGFQMLLMRGFLLIFNGNELVIGMLLSTWMLFTGLGSLLGRFNRFTRLHHPGLMALLTLTGIWPAPSLFLLCYLKTVLIPAGSMADLYDVLTWGTIVQAPFCLTSGFLFTALSAFPRSGRPSASYAWESAGSISACLIVNFVFLWWFDLFTGAVLLSATWFLMLSVALNIQKMWIRSAGLVVFAAVYILIIIQAGLARRTDTMLFPGQRMISDRMTPYGRITVTQTGDQLNVYENGLLLFSSGNTINSEEAVHPAMVQHHNPSKILMISGGFSGSLSEVMKYHPDRIDYLELNPELIRIGARFTGQIKSDTVRAIKADARRFLLTTNERYHVVIVNLPAPATLQINRYYTTDFFEEIRNHLMPDGVIALFLPTSSDYVSPGAADLNSVIFRSLKSRFQNVLIVPLEKNVLLASDTTLTLDIPGRISELNIPTSWVNQYYLDISRLRERSEYLVENLHKSGKLNRDFDPVAVRYQLTWWLDYFSFKPLAGILVFTLLFILLAFSQNRLSSGLFTGGFTLASIEVILILAYQVLFGYLFSMIGAIVLVFMTGLTLGSWLAPMIVRHYIKKFAGKEVDIGVGRSGMDISSDVFQKTHRILYLRIQVLLALFSLLIPAFLTFTRFISVSVTGSHLFMSLLCLFPAWLIGMEYHLAVTISQKQITRAIAGTYSADLFGSAMGAFATGVILLPMAGVWVACIVLGILNLAGAMILSKR